MDLTILSYNTHLFLDSLAARAAGARKAGELLLHQDEARLHGLMARLSALAPPPAIIGLSEVWAHSVSDRIRESLPVGYETFRFSGEPWHKGSCGLVLGVRGRFVDPCGFLNYEGLIESDSWSAKGVVYAKAAIGDRKVLIVQTHAQASYVGKEKVCEAARRRQLQATLFKVLDEEADFLGPAFLLGDLNIVAGSDDYRWFSTQMAARGYRDAWFAAEGAGPGYTYRPRHNSLIPLFDETETLDQRLDYIFYRPAASTVRRAQVLTDFTTARGLELSDHEPLLVTFEV
ncbi:MAG: endonuclease/exonuclease/phosphatase family protein [Pseudomonadota bacterium]